MAPMSNAVPALGVTVPNNFLSLFVTEDSILPSIWSVSRGHFAGQGAGRLSTSEPSLRQQWPLMISGPEDKGGLKTRPGVMLIIFVVSLFASSFPSISKRVKFLRIPKIVFFIGKHFGTGVILSTAFVHLLQDAFSSLHDPRVEARWKLGRWTGLIVLGSILFIFFVEYISTSYVDRLQSYNSVPSSPDSSQPTSPPRSPPPELQSSPISPNSDIHEVIGSPLLVKAIADNDRIVISTEQTPLIQNSAANPSNAFDPHHTHSFSYGSSATRPSDSSSRFFCGHHRHESRQKHEDHNCSLRVAAPVILSEELGKSSASQSSVHGHGHGHHSVPEPRTNGGERCEPDGELNHEVGKKRQVVGILVLQLGIMIHSLVIGLTLAITSGSEFTSLVTAIVFHQLFEGLSLGIRISGLPPSKHEREGDDHFPLLEVTLMILFAITTPVGIVVGLLAFARGTDGAQLKFTQGLMCAISAGMLIYAACVEMLASDFVMDATLWRSPVWKQTVALVSLLIGAAAMAVIGIWH